MNDQKFLQYALEQSFCHPQSTEADGLNFADCINFSDGLMIHDLHNPQLPIFFLPYKKILQNVRLCKSEAKNNHLLNAQLQIFKHDLSENIIIPENIPQIKEICTQYDMPVVNRQAAQKKQIVTTIIPAVFIKEMPQIIAQYQALSEQIQTLLSANPDFFSLLQVQNFALQYRKIMRKCHTSHPIFLLNKKRFISYLCEIIQLLKYQSKMADDFCKTHSFIGYNCPWSVNSAKHCTTRLQILLGMLQPLALKPQMLQLAQMAIADYKKFRQNFQQLQTEQNIKQQQKAAQIYTTWQQCFTQYAQICYLNGVRCAFEHKFLDDCPVLRNPPLPTVSPQDELKKVLKIVDQSQNTIPYNGKINRLYTSSLSLCKQTFSQLATLLQ